MGVIQPARRTRQHLAASSLTIVTLAVLAAALVFIALNAGRIGSAKVGLDVILVVGALIYAASGHLIASRRPRYRPPTPSTRTRSASCPATAGTATCSR
jgi:hypothetical protein